MAAMRNPGSGALVRAHIGAALRHRACGPAVVRRMTMGNPPAQARLISAAHNGKSSGQNYGSTNSSAELSPVSVQNDVSAEEALAFEPRRDFALPTQVPSWYAGHMYSAMRSMPALLSKSPPPLIIEARDARLPLSSINPAFEDMLISMEKMAAKRAKGRGDKGKGAVKDERDFRIDDLRAWRKRRLIVYNKADLIDPRLHRPLLNAIAGHEEQDDNVMLIDSRDNAGMRKMLRWIKNRAAEIQSIVKTDAQYLADDGSQGAKKPNGVGRLSRSAQPRNLRGAFRHTSTPADGVRLVILGMPNVGKSSLLNALRRVGTGGGKAASTAPEPGHTRKLTGTVRITPKHKDAHGNGRDAKKSSKSMEENDEHDALQSQDAGIYVYDTPGVMVPFLGNGRHGAEKGVKLAVAAGIKSSLFDAIGLADYLLYRLNLQYVWQWRRWASTGRKGDAPLPAYLTGLPMGNEHSSAGVGEMKWGPTNDITSLLERLALRAPGTLLKGGTRDLDAAAVFMLNRWRDGKLGSAELDCECFEDTNGTHAGSHDQAQHEKVSENRYIKQQILLALSKHREEVEQARAAGAATSFQPVHGADRAFLRSLEKNPIGSGDEDAEIQRRLTAYSSKAGRKEAEAEAGETASSQCRHALEDAATKLDLSRLVSKHQTRRRDRAIQRVMRANRLREKGTIVRGLLPANRLKPVVAHQRRHSRRSLRR